MIARVRERPGSFSFLPALRGFADQFVRHSTGVHHGTTGGYAVGDTLRVHPWIERAITSDLLMQPILWRQVFCAVDAGHPIAQVFVDHVEAHRIRRVVVLAPPA